MEEGTAIHSSILAWRITRTEEPGRLQSIGYKELDTNEAVACTQVKSRRDFFICGRVMV